MTSCYEVVLAKEDFKFSVAHFTVFAPAEAEVLHGHNYRVRLRVRGPRTDELGLLVDVRRIKTEIRRICADFDGHTLLPSRCPLVTLADGEGGTTVRFGPIAYSLPEESVLRLPLVNISIEELARHIWGLLAPSLAPTRADRLSVEVEETAGQSCVYSAPLEGGGALAGAET